MKKVSDMYLVGTFLALEVPYTEIEEQGSGRKQFVFEEDAHNIIVLENGVPVLKETMGLDELESYHASGNLLLSSDRLCAAIRNVKSIIHARK